jgi:hypothetical protein
MGVNMTHGIEWQAAVVALAARVLPTLLLGVAVGMLAGTVVAPPATGASRTEAPPPTQGRPIRVRVVGYDITLQSVRGRQEFSADAGQACAPLIDPDDGDPLAHHGQRELSAAAAPGGGFPT